MKTLFNISFLSSILVSVLALSINPDSSYNSTCKAIAKSIRSAGVYYSGDPLYEKGNNHWASSSSQDSACVVEPANAGEVSILMKILAKSSTPFGIRSGGHTTNPGFSSTPGVQIALSRLNQATYHKAPAAADGSVGTVEIGPGQVWDDVYAALEPFDVNVVGGRVTGVGVGGLILGGGYSWLSNQYGLTIDTVTAFEVVLPDGTLTTATETMNPDLFFGLKGGFNNFGVVTKITLLAFPQGQVWGGIQTYLGDQIERVNAATVDFSNSNKDPKASIISSITFARGMPIVSLVLFYDGPTPPAGIFERFTSLPSVASNLTTRSFGSLVKASPSDATRGTRGRFNTVPLKKYSLPTLNLIMNQTLSLGAQGAPRNAQAISFSVEPFLPSMNNRNKGGAYPRRQNLLPFNIYFSWLEESNDKFFVDAIKESASVIYKQAVAEGQFNAKSKPIKYGNYALADEDLAYIYGWNLPRLRQIKARYDPNNVMGRAGGFKF